MCSVMMKHQRGAVRAVMDMSLFVLFLLSGLMCSTSGLLRNYHYINQIMTWTEAQSYCRENYTDLATVDSMDDVNMMIKAVNNGYRGSVWIGLKRATQSRWGWSLGNDTVAQYSVWDAEEPNYDGQCVVFFNNLWMDISCATSLFFMCYDANIGYIKMKEDKNWTDAQSYCRQYHTDLATISSPEEQNQINSIVGDGLQVWIGLFLDNWKWSDQWSLLFRNWAAGYPSTIAKSGDCVVMSTDSGKWAHYSCDQKRPFICYDDHKLIERQIIRLNLSCDGKCNLDDSSLQTATVNEICKKLQSMGLGNYIRINFRGVSSSKSDLTATAHVHQEFTHLKSFKLNEINNISLANE